MIRESRTWSIANFIMEWTVPLGVLAACLLGGRASAQSTGTDLCLPGQGGVMSCPCNNPPVGVGKGCGNYGPGTAGVSASLGATGTASVTDGQDTLAFQATAENDTALTLFTQATATSSTGVASGAGVSCLSGSALILYHGNAGTGEPAGQVTRPQAGDLEVHIRSSALGDPISSAQTRYYMAMYRDKNAALAANCNSPSATLNTTQGIAIVWGP